MFDCHRGGYLIRGAFVVGMLCEEQRGFLETICLGKQEVFT